LLINTLSILFHDIFLNVCLRIILKRRAPAAKYEHAVVQYQSQTMGVYGPYQVNDYISKDADKEIYCLDNSQTFIPLKLKLVKFGLLTRNLMIIVV